MNGMFVRSVVVNPLIWRKQTGRPWSTRILFVGERGRCCHQVCSNWRQVGHNYVNCTNIDPETGANTSAPEPSNEPRRRRPRVCSVCGQPGYTRSKCNLYNVDIEQEVNNFREIIPIFVKSYTLSWNPTYFREIISIFVKSYQFSWNPNKISHSYTFLEIIPIFVKSYLFSWNPTKISHSYTFREILPIFMKSY